jgi:hypothetical protein|tara:strand:- start:101 stop:394 length:294 start_codon:yes stop_codon:yes gene_type:complete
MRNTKAKRIRKHSKTLLVSWLHSLLTEEEAAEITVSNYKDYMPDQTHIFVEKQMRLNAYHPKWVIKKINKLLKEDATLKLEAIDLELIKWIANRSQA